MIEIAPKTTRRVSCHSIDSSTKVIPTPGHLTPTSRHRQPICQRLFKFQTLSEAATSGSFAEEKLLPKDSIVFSPKAVAAN
jgi:hypothetical protein